VKKSTVSLNLESGVVASASIKFRALASYALTISASVGGGGGTCPVKCSDGVDENGAVLMAGRLHRMASP
jgi:hypothetical protein